MAQICIRRNIILVVIFIAICQPVEIWRWWGSRVRVRQEELGCVKQGLDLLVLKREWALNWDMWRSIIFINNNWLSRPVLLFSIKFHILACCVYICSYRYFCQYSVGSDKWLIYQWRVCKLVACSGSQIWQFATPTLHYRWWLAQHCTQP